MSAWPIGRSDDRAWFASRDDLELTPQHNAELRHPPPHLQVDQDLMLLLGLYLAEGSCSGRNGIRLSMGEAQSSR